LFSKCNCQFCCLDFLSLNVYNNCRPQIGYNCISGVMVSVLGSRAVDCGFIGGVMVSMLGSRTVDCGFISGVMVSMLCSRAVDCGFECRLGQTKDYKIGISCFFAKHTALRRTSKDWLIMCPSWATCQSTDCCFSEVALWKSN
jgi:hypothetical protein